MWNEIKNNKEETSIYTTYTIGKKTYKVTVTSNTPSNDALRNFAKEFFKQN